MRWGEVGWGAVGWGNRNIVDWAYASSRHGAGDRPGRARPCTHKRTPSVRSRHPSYAQRHLPSILDLFLESRAPLRVYWDHPTRAGFPSIHAGLSFIRALPESRITRVARARVERGLGAVQSRGGRVYQGCCDLPLAAPGPVSPGPRRACAQGGEAMTTAGERMESEIGEGVWA